jgi:hypothetical protein
MKDDFVPQEPPLNRIFGTLRKLWKDADQGHRYQDLASKLSDFLGIKVTPQKLSQWATGSDSRRPPWAAIYWLMRETGHEVKLGVNGARLVRVKKLSGSEAEVETE